MYPESLVVERVLPLAGRRFVVTGGSRGIGAAVVRLALAQGADVVFSYHRGLAEARALCDRLSGEHPDRRCVALPAQVSEPVGVEDFIAAALESLGTVNVLVNNAGVARDRAFARMSRDEWDEVIDTNLGSMFNVTRPLVLPMVKQRSGAIINLTSVVGVRGAPGQVNYAASKAGIIGFTKALAKEVASAGVTVNAVAPGFIETDMTAHVSEERLAQIRNQIPGKRLGTADDVAHLICFLASERARYITGQVIEVTGGLVL